MTKLSDKIIPKKSYEDDRESHDFDINSDEYLGLDVHMIYDTVTSVLMIQISRESLSETNIADYINFFAHKFNMLNDSQTIFIDPLYNTEINHSTMKAKKIEIRFANIEKVTPPKSTSLSKVIESFNSFNGISGSISISVGKSSKKNKLNQEQIDSTIEAVEKLKKDYPNCISTARLSYTENDKSYIYDLFDNILNDYGRINIETRSSLNYDDIEHEMIKLFTNMLPTINSIINR